MKQRKLNKRKGFTLVELLVVIAILAVLATVSVVGYTSFTKKAKVSNDVSLTTQMNTILQANEVTDGKNATPHEAVEELVAGGLDVTKLTPTANDYNYVWDSTQNRIFLLDEDNKVVSPTNLKASDKAVNLFAFVGKETELNSFKKDSKDVYSYYLKDGYDASTLTVSTGLDVGNNKINATYETDSDTAVTIRTNGGELTVNAKNGTVNHYGTVMNVKVEAIKGESYHEYGTVDGTLTLESGHVQVEKNAEVASVVASKSANSSLPTSKLTTTSGSKVGTVVVNDSSVEVKVDNGSNVAEVAPGAGVTIDASKVTGITPSTTVVDTTNSSKFAGGLGTESSPYFVSSREEFINIKYVSSKGYNFKLVNDIDLTDLEKQEEATFNGSECTLASRFSGIIDGNNYNLKLGNTSADEYKIYLFDDSNGTVIFKNINIEQIDNMVGLMDYYGWGTSSANDYLKFENVNVYNSNSIKFTIRNTAYDSPFINLVSSGKKVIWENCNNYANMTSTTYNGIFLANYSGTAYLSFINCHNYGYVTGRNVGFFNGNANAGMVNPNLVEKDNFEDAKSGVANLYIKNCSNEGQMIGTQAASPFMTWSGNTDNSNEINTEFNSNIVSKGLFVNNGIITTSNKNVELNYLNNTLSIAESSDYEAGYTYRIIYSHSISYNGGGSSYLNLSFDLDKDDTIDLISRFVSSTKYESENNINYSNISTQEQINNGIKYKVIKNGNGTYTAIFDNESLKTAYGCDNSTYDVKPSIYVYALNSNESIVGSKLYSVEDLVK